MTYIELIKNIHGNNAATEEMLVRISSNLNDIISSIAKTLTPQDFAILQNGMNGDNSETGTKALRDIVAFSLNNLDIMQLPNDGTASLLDKVGSTVVAILKANLKLFETEPEEEPFSDIPEDFAEVVDEEEEAKEDKAKEPKSKRRKG